MNTKLLDMYGKISILLGEVAPTTYDNTTCWLVGYDENRFLVELSTNKKDVELEIIWLINSDETNCFTPIDNHDTLYTIIGYASALGIKSIND